MNLPYPFGNASGVKANPEGSISLIDADGKSLARVPMTTAFELSPKAEGYGCGFGFGDGSGSIFGDGDRYGCGFGFGDGYGDDVGDGDGCGKSK